MYKLAIVALFAVVAVANGSLISGLSATQRIQSHIPIAVTVPIAVGKGWGSGLIGGINSGIIGGINTGIIGGGLGLNAGLGLGGLSLAAPLGLGLNAAGIIG